MRVGARLDVGIEAHGEGRRAGRRRRAARSRASNSSADSTLKVRMPAAQARGPSHRRSCPRRRTRCAPAQSPRPGRAGAPPRDDLRSGPGRGEHAADGPVRIGLERVADQGSRPGEGSAQALQPREDRGPGVDEDRRAEAAGQPAAGSPSIFSSPAGRGGVTGLTSSWLSSAGNGG